VIQQLFTWLTAQCVVLHFITVTDNKTCSEHYTDWRTAQSAECRPLNNSTPVQNAEQLLTSTEAHKWLNSCSRVLVNKLTDRIWGCHRNVGAVSLLGRGRDTVQLATVCTISNVLPLNCQQLFTKCVLYCCIVCAVCV
jgi:hypothetical protein